MKMKKTFIKGIDISSLSEMLNQDAKYYDFNDEEVDPLVLAYKYGVNFVRLRIWHTPENNETHSNYCGLEETIKMAKCAKKLGMGILLDFHYSDYWADPKKQFKPKAWEDLPFKKLRTIVYDYTKSVLYEMENNGVYPEFVQIGNEIRNGILFPDGHVNRWEQLAQLLNAGIRAVRDTQNEKSTKIILHMDQGGRCYFFKEWFDMATKHGVTDYDIIGISYYPFWHGTYNQFAKTMDYVVTRYDKEVMVVETAQGWRTIEGSIYDKEQEAMSGFPSSPEMQRHVLEIIMGIVASVKDNRGLGIFYWEPFMLTSKNDSVWGQNLGVLNEKGKVLEGIKAFQFESINMNPFEVIKVESFEKMQVKYGQEVELPSLVKVLCKNGEEHYENVQWESFSTNCYGDYLINGQVNNTDIKSQIIFSVKENIDTDYNYIKNGNFDKGLQDWEISTKLEEVLYEVRAEFNKPFPGKPDAFLLIESSQKFEFLLQKKIGIINGDYQITFEYKSNKKKKIDVAVGECNKEIIVDSCFEWNKIIFTFDLEEVNNYLTIIITSEADKLCIKNIGLYVRERNSINC